MNPTKSISKNLEAIKKAKAIYDGIVSPHVQKSREDRSYTIPDVMAGPDGFVALKPTDYFSMIFKTSSSGVPLWYVSVYERDYPQIVYDDITEKEFLDGGMNTTQDIIRNHFMSVYSRIARTDNQLGKKTYYVKGTEYACREGDVLTVGRVGSIQHAVLENGVVTAYGLPLTSFILSSKDWGY